MKRNLKSSPIANADAFLGAEELANDLREKHPLVATDSVDVVVSNCVLNLVESGAKFGISFNRLFTITNMPIARFATALHRDGQYAAYMNLLVENFNPASVDGLMCRSTLNVGWRGEVFDCDFNQMLKMQWQSNGGLPPRPLLLWDIEPTEIEDRPVLVGEHCFGCTAGAGSSTSRARAPDASSTSTAQPALAGAQDS